jgi:hypothetical protein
MKIEGSEGYIELAAALVAALALGGCAAQQQRAVNDAYSAGQQAKAQAVAACAQSARVASCMLGVAVAFGGSGSDSVPVVQSDLSAVLNSSLLGTVAGVVGQVKQSNNARDVAIAQTSASVAIAQSGDARQVQTMQAATGANAAIATGGFSAVAGIAGAGFGALGNAAQSANSAGAANVQALTTMVAAMPPTIQAGRDVIQARDVDQSSTGRDRDVTRITDCIAQGGPGAPATAGNNSATGGATSPLTAGYNPLIAGGDGASGANNCGGG